MLNYQTITATDLSAILNNKNHTVISVDRITTKTYAEPINVRLHYSIPFITEEDKIDLMKTTVQFDENDKESLWNTFIVLAANNGAIITYVNINDVDCLVDIEFN